MSYIKYDLQGMIILKRAKMYDANLKLKNGENIFFPWFYNTYLKI